jgi:hypothetical protein
VGSVETYVDFTYETRMLSSDPFFPSIGFSRAQLSCCTCSQTLSVLRSQQYVDTGDVHTHAQMNLACICSSRYSFSNTLTLLSRCRVSRSFQLNRCPRTRTCASMFTVNCFEVVLIVISAVSCVPTLSGTSKLQTGEEGSHANASNWDCGPSRRQRPEWSEPAIPRQAENTPMTLLSSRMKP